MKQRSVNQRQRIEQPVWCEHCRLRIAPYEEAAIAGKKSFHAHCFRKEEVKKSDYDPREKSGLSLALA